MAARVDRQLHAVSQGVCRYVKSLDVDVAMCEVVGYAMDEPPCGPVRDEADCGFMTRDGEAPGHYLMDAPSQMDSPRLQTRTGVEFAELFGR